MLEVRVPVPCFQVLVLETVAFLGLTLWEGPGCSVSQGSFGVVSGWSY